jgi:hypothetical protein
MPQQVLDRDRPPGRYEFEPAVVFDADLLSRMYFAMGSLSRKVPSSSSIMMPTETIGLVIEKMRNRVLCAIGAGLAGFCRPSASNQPI